MKVLFVINNYYAKGNGLSASARRTVEKLKEYGIDVKVLSGFNTESEVQPDFVLKHFNIPVFNGLVKKQGYQFAKSDKEIIKQAVLWADVVHLEEPFILQIETAVIAKKYNTPCTGTYHLHPENLFASVGLGDSHIFNDTLMTIWRNELFNKCKIIQCPTENVKERLEKWKFKSELRMISNGLNMEDLIQRTENNPLHISDAKYHIITIGRYSVEKDIITLLKAMNYTKYNKDIQLIIAGRGPQEKALKKYADKLYKKGIIKYYPDFGFHSLEELQRLSIGSDLYIHCAYIEVEGLSCMEAIQTGLVPIIAEGNLTATSKFALSDRSKFKARDPEDLAYKIDYWLDNDDLRKEEAKKYIGIGKKYVIDHSIVQLIKMFNDALIK